MLQDAVRRRWRGDVSAAGRRHGALTPRRLALDGWRLKQRQVGGARDSSLSPAGNTIRYTTNTSVIVQQLLNKAAMRSVGCCFFFLQSGTVHVLGYWLTQ